MSVYALKSLCLLCLEKFLINLKKFLIKLQLRKIICLKVYNFLFYSLKSRTLLFLFKIIKILILIYYLNRKFLDGLLSFELEISQYILKWYCDIYLSPHLENSFFTVLIHLTQRKLIPKNY